MNFEVYTKSLSKKDYTVADDGSLIITGVASTTNKDLDGEIVTNQALNSLAKQAKGLNLHLDHNHAYDGGIGTITDSYIDNDKLIIEAKILDEFASDIKKRIEFGMNFGFSVGGKPKLNPMRPNVIDDFDLFEISLTLFPSNWDTYSTVEMKGVVKSTCVTGACNYILKKSYGDKMPSENNNEDNVMTEDKVVAIVNEAFLNKKTELLDAVKEMLPSIVEDTLDTLLDIPSEKAIEENINAEADANADKKEPETSVPNEDDKVCAIEEEENKAIEEPLDDEKAVNTPTRDGVVESTNDGNAPVNSEPVPAYQNEQPALSEKDADMLINAMFKKLNLKEKRTSKLETYKSAKLANPRTKFLDGAERDKFGRNKKYL